MLFVWFFVIYFVKCPQNNSKLVALSLEAMAKSWRQHSDIFCCSKKKIVSVISNYDDCIMYIVQYIISIYCFLLGYLPISGPWRWRYCNIYLVEMEPTIYFGKHFGKIYIFKITKISPILFCEKRINFAKFFENSINTYDPSLLPTPTSNIGL